MTLPSYAMNQSTFPEMYERWLVGPLFRPWAEITLDELQLSPGNRVLDVACGTGIVARVAKERLGERGDVVGVDVSADMLNVAGAVAPNIDWRQGNAAELPLKAGEQFDVVVCQQGMQFFPDRPAAVAEMRRALRDNGKLAISTWRSESEIPFFRDLRSVAERHVGPVTDQRHAFGDGGALDALLREAGLNDVRVKTISRNIRFEAVDTILRLNTMALVGMSGAGKAMDNQERDRVVATIMAESAPVLAPYSDGSGIAFELRTNLAIARK